MTPEHKTALEENKSGAKYQLTSLAAGFPPGTARLELEFLTAGSQHLRAQLGPAGQVDVDGSSHSWEQQRVRDRYKDTVIGGHSC